MSKKPLKDILHDSAKAYMDELRKERNNTHKLLRKLVGGFATEPHQGMTRCTDCFAIEYVEGKMEHTKDCAWEKAELLLGEKEKI